MDRCSILCAALKGVTVPFVPKLRKNNPSAVSALLAGNVIRDVDIRRVFTEATEGSSTVSEVVMASDRMAALANFLKIQ